MATRLYPVTTSVESLEFLAGVPSGTHARLIDLEKRYFGAPLVGDEVDAAFDAWYGELLDNADLGRLDAFQDQGWGRVSGKFVELVEAAGYESGHGEIKVDENRELVTALLQAQGVSANVIDHISGISWG